jgi:hypothetical protein
MGGEKQVTGCWGNCSYCLGKALAGRDRLGPASGVEGVGATLPTAGNPRLSASRERKGGLRLLGKTNRRGGPKRAPDVGEVGFLSPETPWALLLPAPTIHRVAAPLKTGALKGLLGVDRVPEKAREG